MITEEFEDISSAGQKPISSTDPVKLQDQIEKLLRENDELEKSLEKQQFFNKLLEKEINELRTPGNKTASKGYTSASYYRHTGGVSKFAFYTLLIITLILGGFTAYTLLINKGPKSAYANITSGLPLDTIAGDRSAFSENSNTELQQSRNAELTPLKPANTADLLKPSRESKPEETAVVKDEKPAVTKTPESGAKQPVVNTNTLSNATDVNKPAPPSQPQTNTTPGAAVGQPDSQTAVKPDAPIVQKPTALPEAAPATNETTPADPKPAENKPAAKKELGVYKVTSKANFYNEPNENALTGSFIYQFSPATLEALDDSNGFIYVVAVNNLGNPTKGWLSKKDLRRIDK